MKYLMVGKDGKEQVCRTLPGVRGLKCLMFCIGVVGVTVSHPTRGAWIEILKIEMAGNERNVAPYPGCVD